MVLLRGLIKVILSEFIGNLSRLIFNFNEVNIIAAVGTGLLRWYQTYCGRVPMLLCIHLVDKNSVLILVDTLILVE